MTRWRILVVFCLAIISMATLVGGAAANEGKVRLVYWTHTHMPLVELNKKLIQEYQKANPNVEIVYEALPSSDYQTKLLVSMATGTGPDVFISPDRNIPTYVARNMLAPLDLSAFGVKSQRELEAMFIPGSLKGATINGVLYGLPSEFNTFCLFINTAHFKEAGLDPERPPKTWAELGEYGKKLAIWERGRLVREGFDWPYFYPGYMLLVWEPMVRQLGGRILSEDGKRAYVNSPEAVQALQIWYDMIYKYKTGHPAVGQPTANDQMQHFADGQVSMAISGIWALPVVQANPEVYKHVKVVPLPQARPDNPVTVLYGWFWLVNNASKQKKEAWRFVNFLSSKPELFFKEIRFIQPRVGWFDTPEAKEEKFLPVFLSDMAHGEYVFRSPKYPEISDAIGRAIERTMFDLVDPKKSLDIAQKEIEAILAAN